MPVPENLSSLLEVPDLEVTEKNIYYSRPATVFAAVAASIFTIIGVLGECRLLQHLAIKFRNLWCLGWIIVIICMLVLLCVCVTFDFDCCICIISFREKILQNRGKL